ncbi:D-3-phosphoglycerate dehydrogenase 2, partial [Ascosphaera acerosa]
SQSQSQGHTTLGTITASARGGMPKQLKPFATEDIKILLLENVNQTGQDILRAQGYQVEFHKSSLPEDELIEKIRYTNP